MRSSTLKQSISAAALVLAALFHGGAARAEADSFGLGSGHDGALNVTNANQQINAYGQVNGALTAGDVTVPLVGRTGTFTAGQVVLVFQTRGSLGTLLPGSRIPVVSPAALLEMRPDYVLILPWNLKAEIMQEMGAIRAWGGRFVTCIPGLAVE